MTINVGLVGYGLAGSVFHAPLISSVRGLTLTSVVSSKIDTILRDYPAVTVLPTLERLLEQPDISLVVIASPNETHYPYAKQALEAGKHVIVDKPFVIQAGQADELIALARRQNVLLSVYQNRRWDNDFLTIRDLVQTGLLGDIITYEAHYDRFRPDIKNRWREQDLPGSGILYDLGAHLVDQALELFGPPETVWASVLAQRTGALVDDYFHLVLGYRQRQVILHSGSLVREQGPRFQLHGTKGSFIKYGLDPQEDDLKAGKRPGDPGWGEDRPEDYGDLTIDVNNLSVKGKVKTLPGAYEMFYQGIVEAITQGKPAPVQPEEARNVIRVIECAQQSSKEGRAIAF